MGREEGEAMEALGYRAADFIALEEDDVHLPLVVGAPLLRKHCLEPCLSCCSLGVLWTVILYKYVNTSEGCEQWGKC